MTLLTNSRVGASMSDLELRARRGDPWAQDELERQAFQAASMTKTLQRKAGLTREQAQKEIKRG